MSPSSAVQGQVWLDLGGSALGAQRVALLQAVAATGSITQAAKALGISYKAAWDAVDQMNNLAGAPLAERAAGGRGGGATALTPHGEALVERWLQVDALHRRFVEQLAAAGDLGLWRTLNMATLSARNQYRGTVTQLLRGAVNDEVTLTLPGGQTLVATITHESSDALRLAPGGTAFALVQAGAVLLATGSSDGAPRVSARNQLQGVVERIVPGAVNAEVVLALDGGGSIAALVTSASVDALGLAPGVRASALFKASSVMLGVP
jgi:molybdate transport system regulatory protein